MSPAAARTYSRVECVSFRKTGEEFGGLSNMAAGFPLEVNGIAIRTSEALYQACRFPHLPKVQRLIIDEISPMTAKMKSKPYRQQSRQDWDAVRVKVMRWCLRVKLAQNWEKFGSLLLDTGDRPIVEDSRKDDFWGARAVEGGTLVGANVLGRLLMELREALRDPARDSLRSVEAPPVPAFLLYGEPITVIEGRACGARTASLATLRGTRNKQQLRATEASTVNAAEASSSVGSTRSTPSEADGPHKTTASATHSPKRLIEVDLPIKRISAHARREKSIRHGHISTLHIWWARRPLAVCRAVILAALWPDPADANCPERFRNEARERMLKWAKDNTARASAESFDRLMHIRKDASVLDDPVELRKCLLDFIADFANWDNSDDPAYMETSRALVEVAHEALGGTRGTRPLVVDPFSGGGSIPLEALRVGADAFASDLNPVAVLLNRIILEYIPKGGAHQLADDIRTAAKRVNSEARKRLAGVYPESATGGQPIAYLWARTVRCEGPGCGMEGPLLQSFWVARKAGRSVALVPDVDRKAKSIQLTLVENPSEESVHRPTARRGSATCLSCGFTTPVKSVRSQLRGRRGGSADARMTTVVWNETGRTVYREPMPNDLAALNLARTKLLGMEAALLPDEPTPDNSGHRAVGSPYIYGMTQWRDIFSPRQLLCVSTFAGLIRDLPATLGSSPTALRACLALALGKMADYLSTLSTWRTQRTCVRGTFARQTLGFTWDFGEMNPFAESAADFTEGCEFVCKAIERVFAASGGRTGIAVSADAISHPLPSDAASAIVTDPPYYDSVPFAEISDYFYVWLKRILAKDLPEVFADSLTPKAQQAIVWHPDSDEEAAAYVAKMTRSMSEARRVVAPTGICVLFFAHKSTLGWESQLDAMLKAGWIITGSWPVDTERGGRFNAQGAAALASSIQLVCRPRESNDGSVRTDAIGDWRDVLAELPKRIHEWMPRLAEEGVVGADAIFACLGPALEVFSRYSRVEKPSGEEVTLKEYLVHVWAAVAKEALSVIFAGAETSSFEEDARLTAMWLWTVSTGTGNGNPEFESDEGASEEDEDAGRDGRKAKLAGFALEYDAARKIAQGLGVHLEELTTLVEVKGETARLLPVAERTRALFGKDESEAPTARRKKKVQQMTLGFAEELEAAEETGGWGQKGAPQLGQTVLDRVHQAMILFAAGRGEALRRFLVDEGAGRDTRFWRLAQALAALYPTGTDERRWVEGVLARKRGLGF